MVIGVYIEFKAGEKHATKGADISDSHEHFKDAGYLLTENDLIIDIDCLEKGVIEKLISLFNIKTQTVWTDRGVHLYFKKPDTFRGAKGICMMGFPIETKHIKNTKAITVKRNGVLRKIEKEGVREDLPDIFKCNKNLSNLLGMDDGEGRNQALFEHRMKIHTISNWQSILRFINNNIFAKPLDEDEFQSVVRDNVKIEASENNEPVVAAEMMKKYKIVKYMGSLYFRHEGEYISNDDILNRVIYAEVGSVKSRYVDEVIKQINNRCPLIKDGTQFDIKFKNGILRNGEFIEVDYQEFTPYSIDIEYDPNCESVQVVDDYINHLTDNEPEYREFLLEILAHPLIVNKEFKRLMGRFFFFVGDGGNGKGTLLTIIRKILNDKNCSSLDIDKMTDERYLASMISKLVNLGDDIQDKPINTEKMKILKNLSTCDYIPVRFLYQQSRDVEIPISLIFTSNHILKSFEKDHAYKRRVFWLPMYGKPKKKDPKFISNLTTEKALKYWIKLIIDGYFRLYKNQAFTMSNKVEQFNKEYHEENNNVTIFLNDFDKEHFKGRTSPDCHEEYEIWAKENGYSVQSPKQLSNAIYEIFGMKTKQKKVNKKNMRVFMEI